METDPDGHENTLESDTLVEQNESENCEESLEKASETSTLLSKMAGHSSSKSDEVQHPHPYHLRNKYTFRSDSVYSDVIPMSAASPHHSNNKPSDPREKSGSLSSLKAKESKWMTLKKKLGKLNNHSQPVHTDSSSSEKQTETKGRERPQINKSLNEKRSLFQRAKTLSILPVHKSSKDKEDPVPQPKRVREPPELFNVGGEMNLIPLEFLINVNDLDINK